VGLHPGLAAKGLYSPNCRMTAAQVKTFGAALDLSGCGLFMWRYDDAFATNYDNQRSCNDIAATMAAAPAKACRRVRPPTHVTTGRREIPSGRFVFGWLDRSVRGA
jgi:hypothetical protein